MTKSVFVPSRFQRPSKRKAHVGGGFFSRRKALTGIYFMSMTLAIFVGLRAILGLESAGTTFLSGLVMIMAFYFVMTSGKDA